MAWNEPGNNDKDPWSGGKKDQGPPDIDEAIRKLQKRLKTMFGGKGQGPSGETGKAKGAGIGVGIIFLIALVIWGASGIFIVGPADEAVVLRFGKYVGTVGPGPHWIPRFIQSRYVLNVQKISNFSYKAQMLTKDENIVSVSIAVQYRIGDLKEYLFNVVNPTESIQQATASALRQVVGHSTLNAILTTGRETIRKQVFDEVKSTLAIYKAGLEVTDVAMQPARAPEEVKSAFDDAIKAQEDEQRFINQAQAYTARVEPIAVGHAKRIIQEANAYKKQAILRATGDVSRFLALLPEYKSAPRVTRDRLYLEAVQTVLMNTSKVLVDVKGGNNMFYLPLDKLIRQMPARLAKVATASVTSGTQSSNVAKQGDFSTTRASRVRQGRDTYSGRGF